MRNTGKLEGAQRVHIPAKWIFFIITTVRKFWSTFSRKFAFYTSPPQQRCNGTDILRVTPVTFLYISHKPPLWTWTWLHHQKADKTTFPAISCPYGNSVNFSHTSRIQFSANNTSFRPFTPMGLSAHRYTDRHAKVKAVLGGYNYEADASYLPDAVTLGRVYEACQIGLQDHVICCGVSYLFWI